MLAMLEFIQRCTKLIETPGWEVLINHCYREANQVADILANLGVELDGDFIVFPHPLGAVSIPLYADRRGTKFPRQLIS